MSVSRANSHAFLSWPSWKLTLTTSDSSLSSAIRGRAEAAYTNSLFTVPRKALSAADMVRRATRGDFTSKSLSLCPRHRTARFSPSTDSLFSTQPSADLRDFRPARRSESLAGSPSSGQGVRFALWGRRIWGHAGTARRRPFCIQPGATSRVPDAFVRDVRRARRHSRAPEKYRLSDSRRKVWPRRRKAMLAVSPGVLPIRWARAKA